MSEINHERAGSGPRTHQTQRSAWDAHDRPRRGSPPPRNAASGGKRSRTILLVTLLVLCMMTNTVYAGARAVVNKMNLVDVSKVSETTTVTPPPEVIEDLEDDMGDDEFDTSNLVISDKDVEIILLIGADTRPEEKGARSDTLMLVAIDRIHKKFKVISLMRDLYAPISGIKGSNKINYAFYYDTSLGFTDLRHTKGTIENCFGVTIDHYAVVDFNAFSSFIDSLDGIDVEMNEDEAKYMEQNKRWTGDHIGIKAAGTYHLDGYEALHYVRMRKAGNGDYERTDRQRKFLGLLLSQAKKMSYRQMVKALSAVLPYITTDMSENQIFGYCFDAPVLLKYEMVQLRLPVDGAHKMGWATIGSTNVSILVTNYTFLTQVLQDFIYNDDMTYSKEGAKASGVALPRITTIPN